MNEPQFGSKYVPRVNFTQLFSNQNLTAQEILGLSEVIEQVSNQHKIFTSLLITRPDLIITLINYALRPEMVLKEKSEFFRSQDLTKTRFTYLSAQILRSLNQQFYNYLVSPYVFQDHQKMYGSIIEYAFQMLNTNERINQTAAGYLSKLVKQLNEHHHGLTIFALLHNKSDIYQWLIKHIYSSSVMEILKNQLSAHHTKEGYSSNEEIWRHRQELVEKIFGWLPQAKQTLLIESLENLRMLIAQFIEEFSARTSIHIQSLTHLLNIMMRSQNITHMQTLIFESNNLQCITLSLEILSILLNYEILNKTKLERREVMYVRAEVIQVFESVATKGLYLLRQKDLTVNRISMELNMIDKSKLSLFLLIKSILVLDPAFARTIVDSISDIILSLKNYPQNNYLHNCLKDIVVMILKSENGVDVLKKETGLVKFLAETLNKHPKVSYLNQIYHIVKAIKEQQCLKYEISKQHKEVWQESIEPAFKQIQMSYERLIGGEYPKQEKLFLNMFKMDSIKEDINDKINSSEKEQLGLTEKIIDLNMEKLPDLSLDNLSGSPISSDKSEEITHAKFQLSGEQNITFNPKPMIKKQSKSIYHAEYDQFLDDCRIQENSGSKSVGRHAVRRW